MWSSRSRLARTRAHPPGSPFTRPEPEAPPQYRINDRVTHDRYGLGTVVGVREDQEVTVDFGDRSIRIALPHAKLSHL
jgi:hypothetical protein